MVNKVFIENVALVERSPYGTYIVALNGERVGEETNKVKAHGIADFLNKGRAYGFHSTLVAHVTKFEGD